MSNSKISALTSATTPLAGTETLPVVQSSTTKQVSVANLTAGRAVSAAGLTSTGGNSVTSEGTHGAGSFNGFVIKNTLNSGGSGKLVWQGSPGNETWSIAQNQSIGAGYLEFNYLTVPQGYFDPSGNLTLSKNNLVIGTAAKGINFTANTPAAGMTSQLLNWYEEGTWAQTSSSNNLTSIVYSSARYTRIGRQVTLTAYITATVTSLATTTYIVVQKLPFAFGNYQEVSGSFQALNTNINGFACGNNANSIYIGFLATSGLTTGNQPFGLTLTYFV